MVRRTFRAIHRRRARAREGFDGAGAVKVWPPPDVLPPKNFGVEKIASIATVSADCGPLLWRPG